MARALNISFRPMSAADVGHVPTAHQGDEDEVLERIATIGSSALLAFDGPRHIGQLQFRRYVPDTRSANGVWDPLWWMDFAGHAPSLDPLTLAVTCCHVGQLDDTADRDKRYLGRGIGGALLDRFLEWARDGHFASVIAKATPSVRPVMEFLGGFPVTAFRARGFDLVATWLDPDSSRSFANESCRRHRTAAQQLWPAVSFICDHRGRERRTDLRLAAESPRALRVSELPWPGHRGPASRADGSRAPGGLGSGRT